MKDAVDQGLSGIVARAEARLRRIAPPGPDEPSMPRMIDALRDTGLLSACSDAANGGLGLAHLPDRPVDLREALSGVGRADLSAGRIFEGHVNAAKLVALYARGKARDRWMAEIGDGALFGVWGAEGARPVRAADGRLTGEKLFASGADVLDRAIVIARDAADRPVMIVLGTRALRGRLHPEEWSMSGMRATASGRCDLEGVGFGSDDVLGHPGDYHLEPHFKGGVWRYAAVQLGGMQALLAAAAGQITKRGQAAAPLQAERLATMTMACKTAELWLDAAARAVEAPDASPSAAAHAMLARLKTAREAQVLLAALDDALGAASFATAHPAERPRRDLQVYLRQANPDGLLQESLATVLAEPLLAAEYGLG